MPDKLGFEDFCKLSLSQIKDELQRQDIGYGIDDVEIEGKDSNTVGYSYEFDDENKIVFCSIIVSVADANMLLSDEDEILFNIKIGLYLSAYQQTKEHWEKTKGYKRIYKDIHFINPKYLKKGDYGYERKALLTMRNFS